MLRIATSKTSSCSSLRRIAAEGGKVNYRTLSKTIEQHGGLGNNGPSPAFQMHNNNNHHNVSLLVLHPTNTTGGVRTFSSTTAVSSFSLSNTNNSILNAATTQCEEKSPPSSASFDETMTKIFQDEKTAQAVSTVTDAVETTTTTTGGSGAEVFDPTWWNIADQAINAVNYVHTVADVPIGLSIVGVTCCVRVVLLPLFIKSQQNTARMAHMQPEMQQLKAEMDKLGPNPDQQQQVKMGMQMRALFKKYDCNPMRALALPLIQAPMFMGMFFGLRKMPNYFPDELATGGLLWFPDLTVSDPLYILPIGSALSFLIMIELGKEQMMATNPQQGQIMMNVFRGMSFMMIPVATTLSSAVLCYWVTNNSISLLQSIAFRNKQIRKMLNIWDPPKPVPGAPGNNKSIMDSVNEMVDKVQGKAVTEQQKIQQHNEAIDSQKKAAMIRTGRNRGNSVGRRRKK